MPFSSNPQPERDGPECREVFGQLPMSRDSVRSGEIREGNRVTGDRLKDRRSKYSTFDRRRDGPERRPIAVPR